MDPLRLRELLEEVARGTRSIESTLDELRRLPFADLGYARVDHHRSLRQGVPEVVLAEGKTVEQILGITRELVSVHKGVFVTRLSPDGGAALVEALPEIEYLPVARIARYLPQPPVPLGTRPVFVVTAGTSDIPVAEEAIATLEVCGAPVERLFDVGVAGIHRLVGHLGELGGASAVIVVAGMEGALASVLGGLVAPPVVAVPTSVGYGVSLGGLTALFGMLSSCASGVTVVNIDNGFGAAMAVVRILRAQSLGGGE
jgi:pyridinium-3,5-biscarboxylic acid mononucleotide synthase